MSIEDLYPRVTEAIIRAERLVKEGRASEASASQLDVSMLEEAIAEELPPTDPEGILARIGAVEAAVAAQLYLRASELAEKYLKEGNLPVAVSEQLQHHATEAKRKVATDDPVLVDPAARYNLEAA